MFQVLPFLLLAFFDQFPKAGVLLQLFIFSHRQLRAEKEISDRIFVKDAVDKDTLGTTFKVDPVIIGSIAVEAFSLPLDYAKGLGIQVFEVFWQELEFSE